MSACAEDARTVSAQWVARARLGDPDSFRRIFDRYAGPILGFITDMVGGRDLAEDLTQETFVRAFQRIGDLRDPACLSTWLFGIAKNVSREALRARRREGVRVASIETDDPPDPRDPPDAALLRAELSAAIDEAVQRLDDDKRMVFTLRVFQGLSYLEIAEVTGFSMAKLKADLHRARAEMRRRLGPYLELSDEL